MPIENLAPLSRLEQKVMAHIWALGECTANEVTDAIHEEKPLALTTVHTLLGNLCKKGWVERAPRTGRALVFRATVSREIARHRTLRELIANFFGGSPQDAVLCLLRDEHISAEEREELRRLIAESREDNVP